MNAQSIQALQVKANAHNLTDADHKAITDAGLVLMNTIGTSLDDVLARQAMRRQNNVVRG